MRRALGVALVISAVAGPAYAQSSDASATAERLFNEGRELVKTNRWSEACPKFEASLRLDPALGTRLNLATCYEHVGKLAHAWALYRESIDLAQKADDVKRRDYAQAHAAELEPRLARLAIVVPGKPPAGLVVRWDGTPLEAGALDAGLYADPGPHTLIASAPGFNAFTRTVTLVEGKTETITITGLTAAPVQNPAPAEPDPTELAVAPSPTRKFVAIGLATTGLATAGSGLLFGARASSTFRDAKKLCGPRLTCNDANYDRGKQLIRDARFNATISTVLVAAGGAAIIASAVVLVIHPKAREQRITRIAPVAHERGAGLAIVGRF